MDGQDLHDLVESDWTAANLEDLFQFEDKHLSVPAKCSFPMSLKCSHDALIRLQPHFKMQLHAHWHNTTTIFCLYVVLMSQLHSATSDAS